MKIVKSLLKLFLLILVAFVIGYCVYIGKLL